MSILYALIAFSVVMIVMTTLVVALVELVNSLRGIRKRHMRYLLGAVFDEYLWPQFGNLIGPPDGTLLRAEPDKPDFEEELRQPVDGNWLVRIATILDVPRNVQTRMDPGQSWKNRTLPRIVIGLAFWLVFVLLALMLSDYLFFFFAALVFILWMIDLSRESERDNFSLWFGLDAEEIDLMKEMDRLRHDMQDDDLPDDIRVQRTVEWETLNHENPKARDLYHRIGHRRLFVDELVNVAKAMAADPGRAKTAKQNQLSVVEFAAHLGRTQFGDAIRRVSTAQMEDAKANADEMLDQLLTEMARRYDSLGRQSTENFRVLTRRWSVILAFAIALIANVDAPRLFSTFAADTDLSRRVDETFSARLEVMSQQEQQLVERLEAVTSKQGTELADVKEEIEAIEKRIEAFKTQTKNTLGELTEIGVPVGWEMFPLCGSAPKETVRDTAEGLAYVHRDGRCRAMVLATAQSKRDWATGCKKKPANGDEGPRLYSAYLLKKFDVYVSYAATLDRLKSGTFVGAECHGSKPDSSQQSAQSADKKSPLQKLAESFRHGTATLSAHLRASRIWIDQRWDHGLRSWAFGVLLAGLLIGLGGPFWYDIYKRLSGVAQMARSLGTAVSRQQQPDPANPAPETEHEAKNVREAFKTAQTVRMQVDRYHAIKRGFELQAEMTETAGEDEGLDEETQRIPLDDNGNPLN